MKYYLCLLILVSAAANAQTVELFGFGQPATGSVAPGSVDNEVLQFRLYRNTGSPATNCTEVRISLLGTATTTDWVSIKLYRDADSSGTINVGDTQLAATAVTVAGKAVLAGLTEAVQEGFGAGRDYLVTVDVDTSPPAALNNTFQFRLLPADVIVSAGTVSGPGTGITSNIHTIKVDSGAEMDVLYQGLALFSGISGSTDIGVLPLTGRTFTLTVENNGINPLLLSGTPVVAFSNLTNCTASLTNSPSTNIGAGLNTTISINVDPGTATGFSFRIDIANNDFNEDPYILLFHGTAAALPYMRLELTGAWLPDGSSTPVGSRTAGVSFTRTYSIINDGNAALDLTNTPMVTFPLQQNCSCALTTPPAGSIAAPGGTTNFVVTITPTGSGNWAFQVYIENNDLPRNPYTASFTGSSPAVTATELRMFTQPAASVAGVVLAASPVVGVTNSVGAVDTSNNSAQVTVAITTGTGTSGAILSGTLTRTVFNGYATFSDLVIDTAGTGYTLTFTHTNGSFGTVASNTFAVTDPPPAPKKEKKKEEEESGCSTSEGKTPWWLLLACGIAGALLLLRARRTD